MTPAVPGPFLLSLLNDKYKPPTCIENYFLVPLFSPDKGFPAVTLFLWCWLGGVTALCLKHFTMRGQGAESHCYIPTIHLLYCPPNEPIQVRWKAKKTPRRINLGPLTNFPQTSQTKEAAWLSSETFKKKEVQLTWLSLQITAPAELYFHHSFLKKCLLHYAFLFVPLYFISFSFEDLFKVFHQCWLVRLTSCFK